MNSARFSKWMKTARMSPIEVRKALKELLDAALTRADAGSIAPRPHPSETMFMPMLIQLKMEVGELGVLMEKSLKNEEC